MYLAKSEKQNQSIYDYFDLKFVTICIHIIFKEMTHKCFFDLALKEGNFVSISETLSILVGFAFCGAHKMQKRCCQKSCQNFFLRTLSKSVISTVDITAYLSKVLLHQLTKIQCHKH